MKKERRKTSFALYEKKPSKTRTCLKCRKDFLSEEGLPRLCRSCNDSNARLFTPTEYSVTRTTLNKDRRVKKGNS